MDIVDNGIQVLRDKEVQLVLSLGLVKQKQFYYHIYDTNTQNKVGECGIRLLQEKEHESLGNIECEILESYQEKYLAYKANLLLSSVALSFGIRKVSITKNSIHLGSMKKILSLGAERVFVEQIPKQYKLDQRKSKRIISYDWLEEKRRNR